MATVADQWNMTSRVIDWVRLAENIKLTTFCQLLTYDSKKSRNVQFGH
jgi:hypothetical protein